MKRSAIAVSSVILVVAAFALYLGCSVSSTADEGDGGTFADTGGGGGGDTGGGHDAGQADTGPVDAGTSPGTACGDVAHARCARLDSCSNGTLVTVRYGDTATCESREKASCLASLAAPSAGGTPDTVEACARALPGEGCSDFLDTNPVAVCVARSGGLENGKPCAFSGQCTSTYCSVDTGGLCGVCAAVPAQNDSCGKTADCGNRGGLVCANNVCVAHGALNAQCDSAAPCGPGLTCVGSSTTVKGTCQASGVKAGDTCDPKHQTGAGCDKNLGLTCDTTAKTCVTVTLVGAGEVCDNKLIDCKAGAACVVPSGASQGTCVAAANDGEACDTGAGPSCLPTARCVWTSSDGGTAGVCTLPDGTACK